MDQPPVATPATPSEQRKQAQRVWADSLLAKLQSQGFYGRVSFIIEKGNIERAVKEESLVPHSIPEK